MAEETGALIAHVPTRHRARQREDLAALLSLAERVARAHAGNPDTPKGPADALDALVREMQDHTPREEAIPFLARRAGGVAVIVQPISGMRTGHHDHTGTIESVRQITKDMIVADHTFRSWRSLYTETALLLDELAARVELESDVLFSRFEPAA